MTQVVKYVKHNSERLSLWFVQNE